MDVFKLSLADGQESKTERFWTDSAGVIWPIYRKKLAIAALANAGSVAIAHGVATIKLNGLFRVVSLVTSNAGNTLRAHLTDIRITSIVLTDATNIGITNTADLTLYSGSIEIEYNKTTDNV
jgi:hypothetical protein